MRNIDARLVCQQYDPDLWHEPETEQKAITLCLKGKGGGPCPALAACLDLSTDPTNAGWTGYGVWGGVSEHDRTEIRKRRTRKEDDRYPTVTFTTTDCRYGVQELSS
jgi:hypothetical protein